MRYRRINPFIRAHGAAPGPLMRPRLTGIIASGISAAVLFFAFLFLRHQLEIQFQFDLATMFYGFILYSLIAGALYGGVYRRAANDRKGGWIFGASTGFILWMLNPLIWLPWFGSDPLFVGFDGLLILFAHVVHGLVMGSIFPWIHLVCARHWEASLQMKS